MAVAFVFPGQGSQSVGMLAELGDTGVVRETFATASHALGYDLWEVVRHGPRKSLDVTECTQPAMLTVGVAMWRLWRERGGPLPQVMAGHSLGEYTALVCADALDFATAVALVRFRGRLMQEAVPAGQGAMAAILGLDDAGVEAACKACTTETAIVEPVNFNAPGQIVIAGHAAAVECAIKAVRAAGARRAIQLPVSVPSHSSLMRPAAIRLGERLAGTDFALPRIQSVYTVGLRKHETIEGIRAELAEQLYSPVHWPETIRKIRDDDGVRLVIECGPGKVLTGLNRRIDRSLATHAIYDDDSLNAALEAVQEYSA